MELIVIHHLGSHSISKVTILNKALSFIQSMEDKLFTLNQRLSHLRVENETIEIGNNTSNNSNSKMIPGCVNERDVFQTLFFTQLFCTFLEYLFVSFSDAVDISNFESLSLSIVHWIEILNAPDTLGEILTRFYHFEIDCKHIII